MDTPKLKLAEVYLIPTEGGLTLRTPSRSAVLRGKLVSEIFPLLLPLLDGTRTAADIQQELAPQFDPTSLQGILERLDELGMTESVRSYEEVLTPELRDRVVVQDRFFRQYGGDDETMTRVLNARIVLAGDGPLMPSLGLFFAQSGIAQLTVAGQRPVSEYDVAQSVHLSAADVGQSWGVVISKMVNSAGAQTKIDDVDFPSDKLGWQRLLEESACGVLALETPVVSTPWLEDFNLAAIETDVSWTSASMQQRATVRIGPTIIPRQTACWKCFEMRFKSNLSSLERYEEFEQFMNTSSPDVRHGVLPTVPEFTAGVLGFEAMRIVAGGNLFVRTAGSMLDINLWELSLQTHPVLKLPRCGHCSPVTTLPRERMWS